MAQERSEATWAVPMFVFCMGAVICILHGHPELAGLGLMIMAGALRIIWGIEERD